MTQRANVDIAITQSGVNGAKLLINGATGINPTEINPSDLRGAIMVNAPNYVGWWDDFLGDTLNTTYAADLSTGATAAIEAAARGTVRISTSTTDENHATLALGLHFTVSNGPTIFEARVTNVSAATSRSVEIGLSDALSETLGEAFSSHDATLVDVATDAAVFAINAEESVTAWKAISVNAGGTPAGTSSGVTAAAGTFDVLRIEIDAAGNASFFVNDTFVATHALAVATTALLTPWITVTTQTTGDRQVDVDYWMVAQPR